MSDWQWTVLVVVSSLLVVGFVANIFLLLGVLNAMRTSDLGRAMREVRKWNKHLKETGIDLSTNAHLKVRNEALEFANSPSLEEAADVFISLMTAVFHWNWTPRQFTNAVFNKMKVNWSRQWGLSEDGTYQHRTDV